MLQIVISLFFDNYTFFTTSHTDNLELKKIAILEKYGKKEIKIPAKFNFYIMILCLTGGSLRKINHYKYNIREYSLQLIPPNFMHSFYDIFENTKYLLRRMNLATQTHKHLAS